jgi:DNA-binding GntR family transcriptional regulator
MLCKVMSVSRTSIREALRRLEGEKLVLIIPNRGPSVAEISWSEAEGIYKVRALLEAEAVRLFSTRATGAEIRLMQNALSTFGGAVTKNDAIGRIAATNAFYDVVFQGCGNSIIGEILEGLMARINLLRSQSMSRAGRSKFSVTELRKILRAIESGNSKAAKEAAIQHIKSACAAAHEVFDAGRSEKTSDKRSRDMGKGRRAPRLAS